MLDNSIFVFDHLRVENMTDNDKAVETLIWIYEYIRELPNSDWNISLKLATILDKVETTLKGFEK